MKKTKNRKAAASNENILGNIGATNRLDSTNDKIEISKINVEHDNEQEDIRPLNESAMADDASEKRIKYLVFVLGAIIILTLGGLIFAGVKKSNQYDYNGFAVSKFRVKSAPNVVFHSVELITSRGVYNVPLRSDPRQIENIPINLSMITWMPKAREADNYNLDADKIYMTFSPNYSGGDLALAGGELARVFGTAGYGIYNVPTGGAYIEAPKFYSEVPVITCTNAGRGGPAGESIIGVIWFKLGDENRVYNDGDCVILEGKSYTDLIKVADRFLLEVLGV